MGILLPLAVPAMRAHGGKHEDGGRGPGGSSAGEMACIVYAGFTGRICCHQHHVQNVDLNSNFCQNSEFNRKLLISITII